MFCFPREVPGEPDPLSFYKLCTDMQVNKMIWTEKFPRVLSHDLYWENKTYKLKRSINYTVYAYLKLAMVNQPLEVIINVSRLKENSTYSTHAVNTKHFKWHKTIVSCNLQNINFQTISSWFTLEHTIRHKYRSTFKSHVLHAWQVSTKFLEDCLCSFTIFEEKPTSR